MVLKCFWGTLTMRLLLSPTNWKLFDPTLTGKFCEFSQFLMCFLSMFGEMVEQHHKKIDSISNWMWIFNNFHFHSHLIYSQYSTTVWSCGWLMLRFLPQNFHKILMSPSQFSFIILFKPLSTKLKLLQNSNSIGIYIQSNP